VSGLVAFAAPPKDVKANDGEFFLFFFFPRQGGHSQSLLGNVSEKPKEEMGEITHWLVKDEQKTVVTAHDS